MKRTPLAKLPKAKPHSDARKCRACHLDRPLAAYKPSRSRRCETCVGAGKPATPGELVTVKCSVCGEGFESADRRKARRVCGAECAKAVKIDAQRERRRRQRRERERATKRSRTSRN